MDALKALAVYEKDEKPKAKAISKKKARPTQEPEPDQVAATIQDETVVAPTDVVVQTPTARPRRLRSVASPFHVVPSAKSTPVKSPDTKRPKTSQDAPQDAAPQDALLTAPTLILGENADPPTPEMGSLDVEMVDAAANPARATEVPEVVQAPPSDLPSSQPHVDPGILEADSQIPFDYDNTGKPMGSEARWHFLVLEYKNVATGNQETTYKLSPCQTS